MSLSNLLANLLLLALAEGSCASGVANSALKVGRRIVRVDTGVLGIPVVNLGVVEDIAVGHAVARVDAVKGRAAAQHDGDLLLNKLAILDSA